MRTLFDQKSSHVLFLTACIAALLTFTSCTDQEKENTRKSLNDFKAYVKQHKDATADYADEKWEDMEREYDEKKAGLDKNMDKMDNEMKAHYQAAVADWESFKADYQAKRAEKDAIANAEKLKTTIIPEGIHTDLSNVTSKNIASVFEHFVTTVDNQKEIYSKEEWININNYWKSLNDMAARMNDANQISGADTRKIDGQRIKYSAIKVMNKPFAESENK
jgi:hypothetical protein